MITVEKIGVDAIDTLRDIGIRTFTETFGPLNTPANMKKYLDESFAIERLEQELKNPNSVFYFAKEGEAIIGYLKLNFAGAQTELNDGSAVEIERIYVVKEYQGKKIGQLLYDKAIEVAKETEAAYVWLGVWEENVKAIAFYNKNGFVPFDKHRFTLGEDVQTDIMMKKVL